MKVQAVCAAGNTETCERVKFSETGSFTGGVVGGSLAGLALTAPIVTGLCVALGVPTAGASLIVCGVLVVGAASFAAGSIGAAAGEAIGEKIYEAAK